MAFLLKRDKKLGLGSAYIEGFKWALKEEYSYIFEMDADLSHNPTEIKYLKELLTDKNYDVSIGSRYLEGISVVNWPLSRIFLSYFANLYVRIITGMKIKDATSGFVGYTNKALLSLNSSIAKLKSAFLFSCMYCISFSATPAVNESTSPKFIAILFSYS